MLQFDKDGNDDDSMDELSTQQWSKYGIPYNHKCQFTTPDIDYQASYWYITTASQMLIKRSSPKYVKISINFSNLFYRSTTPSCLVLKVLYSVNAVRTKLD